MVHQCTAQLYRASLPRNAAMGITDSPASYLKTPPPIVKPGAETGCRNQRLTGVADGDAAV
jgi:hypothetical protein